MGRGKRRATSYGVILAMAYCTQADIEASIGGASALVWLSDLTNTAIDTDAVSSAIEWSTNLIDSYAVGTPETNNTPGDLWGDVTTGTPEAAKSACVTLCIFRLYQTIWRDIPASVQSSYDRAIRELELLRDGRVSWLATQPTTVQNLSTFYFQNSRSPSAIGSYRTARRRQTDSL
jgi:hypothetical protein